jgi:hypothetical protein
MHSVDDRDRVETKMGQLWAALQSDRIKSEPLDKMDEQRLHFLS